MIIEYLLWKRARNAEDMARTALVQNAQPIETSSKRQYRLRQEKFCGWAIIISFLAWMIFGGPPT